MSCRDASSFLFRRVGGEIVDQANIFHHRRDVVHQLEQEFHIGSIRPRRAIDDVHPPDCLMPVINRHGKILVRVEHAGEFVSVGRTGFGKCFRFNVEQPRLRSDELRL